MSPAFKFFMRAKKSVLPSCRIIQLFGVLQEYSISGIIHTISALRAGGDALEEQCAQVKDYSHTPREDLSLLQQPASWEMLAGRLFWFDRSPLIQRIMLVVMTIVFLDAPMWSADSDILPFVLSNASLPCISAVCASLLSSTSVALSQPAPNFDKKNVFQFSGKYPCLRIHLHMICITYFFNLILTLFCIC